MYRIISIQIYCVKFYDYIFTIFNKAPVFKQGINDSFIHICIF